MSYSLNNIHFLIIFIFNAVIAAYVYVKNPQRSTNKSFSIISINAGLWILFLFLLSNNANHAIVLIFSKAAFFFGMLVPAALLHFVSVYPYRQITLNKILNIYIPAGVLSVMVWSNLVISDAIIYSWGVKVLPGPLYIVVLAYFMVYIMLVILQIQKGLKKSSGQEKKRWIYIVFGLPLPIIHILITNLILPRLGVDGVYKLGPWASLEMMLILGYAIVRYKLFDIDLALLNFTLYGALTFILFIINLLFWFILKLLTDFQPSWSTLWLPLLFTAIFVLIVFPLRTSVEKFITQTFFKKQTNYYNDFNQISDNIARVRNVDDLIKLIGHRIFEKLNIEFISIFRIVNNLDHFKCRFELGNIAPALPQTINKDHILYSFLNNTLTILETAKLKHDFPVSADKNHFQTVLQTFLDEIHAALVIPILMREKLTGFVIMGKPKNRWWFRNREIYLLKNISTTAALTLENLLLYEKVTQENRLEIIGTLATSLAHEIHNPLTSINSFVSMISTHKNNQKFMDKISGIIPKEIKRITEITKSLMDFAKAKELQIATVDITAMINHATGLLEDKIKELNLNLKIINNNHETLQADENQLMQVLINLLLNAIQASKNNGLITISINPTTLNNSIPAVAFSVTDTGEGIKKDVIDNIFDPFFSTKVYGTGLGLPTCKRIVERHSGTITVQSNVGSGSTFCFTIPTLKA